jgi:hypothetical protein
VLSGLRDRFRRICGTWSIVDPKPIAASAPYTFFLPSENELSHLQAGDLVKLIFGGWPESRIWDSEKMWVEITSRDNDDFCGKLANEPLDPPQLQVGKPIKFSAFHIVDFIASSQNIFAFDEVKPRQYWDRCLVEDIVLYNGMPVGYLYRETPEVLEDETKYKDSGWRIRGDHHGVTEKELVERATSFVALGAVLNRDDSWVHLIDEEIGCRFTRNFLTNKYTKVD